jgi:hypothetical protein
MEQVMGANSGKCPAREKNTQQSKTEETWQQTRDMQVRRPRHVKSYRA